MRDMGTFKVSVDTLRVPKGNHFGYIDFETNFYFDHALPFPHLRAESRPSRQVLRVERSLHPEWFAADNVHVYLDVEVSDLVREGAIAFDQRTVPDVLAMQKTGQSDSRPAHLTGGGGTKP